MVKNKISTTNNEKIIRELRIRQLGYWYEVYIITKLDENLKIQIKEIEKSMGIKIVLAPSNIRKVAEPFLSTFYPNLDENLKKYESNYDKFVASKFFSEEDKGYIWSLVKEFRGFSGTEVDYLRLLYVEDDPLRAVELKLGDKHQEMTITTPCVLHAEITVDDTEDGCKQKIFQIYKFLSTYNNYYPVLFASDLNLFISTELSKKINIYSKLIVDGDETNSLANFNKFKVFQDRDVMQYFDLPNNLRGSTDSGLTALDDNQEIAMRISSDFAIHHGHIFFPYSMEDVYKRLDNIDNHIKEVSEQMKKSDERFAEFAKKTDERFAEFVIKNDKIESDMSDMKETLSRLEKTIDKLLKEKEDKDKDEEHIQEEKTQQPTTVPSEPTMKDQDPFHKGTEKTEDKE